MTEPNEQDREGGRWDSLRDLQTRVEAAIEEVRPKLRKALEELDAKVDAAVADMKPRAESARRAVQPKVDQLVTDMQPRLDSLLERLAAKIEGLRRDLDARASRGREEEREPAGQIGRGVVDPGNPDEEPRGI